MASKKNTIFTPARGPKTSFVSELYQPYFEDLAGGSFPELALTTLLATPALKRLYDLMVENIQASLFKDAIFFGDKLLSLSGGNLGVVFLLGQCYFHNGDFKKVHSLFSKYKVLSHNINFQVLAAKALLANKQYELCSNVLDMQVDNYYANKKLEGAKSMIKAQCCEAGENKLTAISMYYECLKRDPTCVEAFNRLIDCNLLSNLEKEQLLTMLNFNPEDIWIKKYYRARIKDELLSKPKQDVMEEEFTNVKG
jgi:tetratricopeptide (TPR) repeat protein